MKPLFSVIVPIYNVEKYLSQCIESLINQSYENIEIILVDDGSTDKCARICDEYAAHDSRIKVVHKQNGGLVSARQAGSNEVTGEYIINVDGDDWISPDYCKKFAEIIKTYHPDIVCCGSYWAFERENSERTISFRKGFYSKEEIKREIYPNLLQTKKARSFPLSLWAKATIAPLQQQQQLVDVVVNVGEDQACMCPCIYHANSMYIMDDCLYYYRQNPSSMTKSGKVYDWNGPEIRGRHLERLLVPRDDEMQNQIYRSITHSLFNIVTSQFNRTDTKTSEIIKDIKKHLDNPYYQNAINQSDFSGVLANLMRFALKWRILILFKIYNNLK